MHTQIGFSRTFSWPSVLPVLIHMSFSVSHPKTYEEMEDFYILKDEERDSFSIYRDCNQSKCNGTDSFLWIIIHFLFPYHFEAISTRQFLDSLLSKLHRFRVYDFLTHSNEYLVLRDYHTSLRPNNVKFASWAEEDLKK